MVKEEDDVHESLETDPMMSHRDHPDYMDLSAEQPVRLSQEQYDTAFRKSLMAIKKQRSRMSMLSGSSFNTSKVEKLLNKNLLKADIMSSNERLIHPQSRL